MAGAQLSIDQASPSITCLTLSATGTGVDGFTPAFTDTPCRAVKLILPTVNTPAAAANAGDVLFGSASVQNDYINASQPFAYINIDNLSKLHLKFTVATDKLEIRVEK